MSQQHLTLVARELGLKPEQVQATARLLDEGCTVPFIARYRKEATGELDEVAIMAVRDRLHQLRELDSRRESILKSLEERGLLSDELKEQLEQAATITELEDLYLPFRPKRRTRAMKAREKGLEPLALAILAQDPALDPAAEAQAYLNPEKELEEVDQALAGARDIIAEMISEDPDTRAAMRRLYEKQAVITSKVIKGEEEKGAKFKDYFDWSEPALAAAGHRVLAMRRGEKEGHLILRITVPQDEAIALLEQRHLKNHSPAAQQVALALADGFKRLLGPAMETEMRLVTKERAEREAIRVFAENLRELLLAPPLGPRRVLALDPGYRTGCKLVCLNEQGDLLHHDVINIMTARQRQEAADKLKVLVQRFRIQAIAVGNGTAGRETEALVRSLELPDVVVEMVNESGASVYSASQAAREEFPELDVSLRGAVSIGRRLMDPLAELVKIDPKSIGVGQYQHDVDQGELARSLQDVVISCVNAVGVEVNTASPQLLAYVSGLGPSLARRVVAYREEHGPFRHRGELMQVPRLGPKAFEQAAGFLRIRDGENPLDASAVHPESYPVVEAMAADLSCRLQELIANQKLIRRIDPARYVDDKVGLPTINDILTELAKPGRDPRRSFEVFSFAEGVNQLEDLEPGMRLPGIVTNVTNFGAFVDIGVHQDGLVHISQMADHFVKDPRQELKVHQRVMVTVLEVDLTRRRIALSMRSDPFAERKTKAPRGSAGQRAGKPSRPAPKAPFNDALARVLGDLRRN